MTFWIPHRLDDNRFRLSATQAGCVGIPGRYAMMGGVTNAAVVTAMEEITGRQLLWSTTQFVSHAPAEVDFDIRVSLLADGGSITRLKDHYLMEIAWYCKPVQHWVRALKNRDCSFVSPEPGLHQKAVQSRKPDHQRNHVACWISSKDESRRKVMKLVMSPFGFD